MKNFLTILILGLSTTIFSAHHEETDSSESEHEYNFAYNSTYTIPAGSQPQRVERSILENLATLEENGYYNCGLLRHQFGGERAYYSYCYLTATRIPPDPLRRIGGLEGRGVPEVLREASGVLWGFFRAPLGLL